jgi:hypothetical protein
MDVVCCLLKGSEQYLLSNFAVNHCFLHTLTEQSCLMKGSEKKN